MVHGLNVERVTRTVTQCLAQDEDHLFEDPVGDEAPSPDSIEELFFGDQPARMGEQFGENVKSPWRQGDLFAVPKQHAIAVVESKLSEFDLNRRFVWRGLLARAARSFRHHSMRQGAISPVPTMTPLGRAAVLHACSPSTAEFLADGDAQDSRHVPALLPAWGVASMSSVHQSGFVLYNRLCTDAHKR